MFAAPAIGANVSTWPERQLQLLATYHTMQSTKLAYHGRCALVNRLCVLHVNSQGNALSAYFLDCLLDR